MPIDRAPLGELDHVGDIARQFDLEAALGWADDDRESQVRQVMVIIRSTLRRDSHAGLGPDRTGRNPVGGG